MELDDINVVKRGERVYEGSIGRYTKGLRLYAKVHPSVEDLMRSWGTGSTESVSAYGRYWSTPNGDNAQVYTMSAPQNTMVFNQAGTPFRLGQVGHPLITEDGTLNLSFLRLVGISSGLKIDVRGVFSHPELLDIREKIKQGVRSLYVSYLLPVDLNLVISTEDIRR